MFQSGWLIVQEAYDKYAAAGVVQLLLISAVIVLLIREKRRENRHLAYFIVTLVTIICLPPIALIFAKLIGNEVYWRVFWLVPVVIVISYVVTRLIEHLGKKSKQRITFLAFVLLIIIGGKCIYNSENFNKSANQYKIPQEAIDICEMVAHNKTTRMVVPETLVSYIRMYNPKIRMMYGRNLGKDIMKGPNYEFLLQLNSANPDIEMVAEYARTKKCKYVVFENTSNGIDLMKEYGYEIFGSTDNYTVFRNIE